MILCKNKNEIFKDFIYLNGGWVYYKKCPLCLMIEKSDGSNHEEFYDAHEDLEYNEHGKSCKIKENHKISKEN